MLYEMEVCLAETSQQATPLTELVSMKIQCRRLSEEKMFLLGGNQASALVSNHVKY